MITAVLSLSYNGSPFCGFARQQDVLTVQGNLEEALRVFYKRDIKTTCAGRTDAGVHAKGQVVSFSISDKESQNPRLQSDRLVRSLNSLTHENIHILKCDIVHKEFSARHDAKSREYSYFICNQPTPSIQFSSTSWHVPQKLDVSAMQQACKHLLGEQDFVSFCVAQSAKLQNSTCRNIISAEIAEHLIFGDNILEIKICGNAFLHSMVRTIVGTLLQIGLSKHPQQWMKSVIESKNRQAAGECAPAHGLIFMNVNY